ncbi:FAD-dependent oxidoreductase [Geminisphaera colitermitum]|uniref:FAD-dependent oxidoreductase n=1 Tax=Geminisphaera colitermitum TaxID=1148786 RepID=UPI000158C6BD|nr:FAD-dependent oxidoreductase [Geminisphaera colitermitum]
MQTHVLETDLLVAGGGMSGVCAALAAARNGARVVLVQDRSMLGGNASSEIKMHIVGADCHGGKPGLRESGIIEELRLDDAVRNPHRCYAQWDLLLYEKVKLEPNITLLLDTIVTGAEVKDGIITAAHAVRHPTEDAFTIRAKFFADCTGDGRLGVEAGADYHVGREAKSEYNETLARDIADKHTLGSSILLTGRKYDKPQPFIAPSWVRKFQKSDFKYRPINSYEYGYWWFEWGGQFDTIKDNEKIRHELLRITLGVWDYIKNSGDHPNSANWALDWVAPIPGKRESRRFLGAHVLKEQDVLGGRIFDDQVAYGGWAIDLHPPSGVDVPDERPFTPTQFKHIYTIPFGCYHSRNIGNLLFAGRNISATHVAFASTRVMATCAIGGQAIGTAAALWMKSDDKTNDLRVLAANKANIIALQRRLQRDDAWLPSLPTNADPANMLRAGNVKASATSEVTGIGAAATNVLDGTPRDLKASFALDASQGASARWTGDTDSIHRWESAALPATLTLALAAPAAIREVHVTFDSGFERELILSMSDSHTSRSVRAAQPETVKDYRLKLDGKVIAEVTGNWQRKRIHTLATPMTGSKLEIEVLATNGAAGARVYEVQAFA